MLNVSAILQQATEVLTGRAEEVAPDAFDAVQALSGFGLDSEFVNGLPLDDPGELFSQLGIEDALPVDPSILAAASDVLAARAEAG